MRRATLAVLALLLALTIAAPAAAATPTATPTATPNGTATPTPTPDNTTVGNQSDSGAGTIVDARAARFVVRQPHYIDADVTERTADGTPVYEARGEVLTLKPETFAAENVVDFGVAPAGEVTLDRELGAFKLRAPAAGTYTLTFVVQRERPTANGTQTVSVRYAARVRVTGGTDLTHQSAESIAALQDSAVRWDAFNSSIHQAGYVDRGETTDEVVNSMIAWYQANPAENPLSYLTGNYFALLLTIAISIPSGLLVWLTIFGPPAWLAVAYKRALLRFERMEAEEGSVRDAISKLASEARHRNAQQVFPQDVFDSQEVAYAFSQAFGPDGVVGATMADIGEALLTEFHPRNLMAGYLQIAGANGWVGRETGDGVELAREDSVPGGVATVDLREVTHESEVLDRVDWPAALRAIDLSKCETVPDEVAEQTPAFDPAQTARQWEVDLRHFEDEDAFAEAAADLVGWLADHSTYSGPDGAPKRNAFVLGRLQKFAAYMDDIERWPFDLLRDALDAGQRRRDAADDLDDLVTAVKENKPGDGGDSPL